MNHIEVGPNNARIELRHENVGSAAWQACLRASRPLGAYVDAVEADLKAVARDLLRKAIEEEAKSPPDGICMDAWVSWLTTFEERGSRAHGHSVHYLTACIPGVRAEPPKLLLALHERLRPRGWWERKLEPVTKPVAMKRRVEPVKAWRP